MTQIETDVSPHVHIISKDREGTAREDGIFSTHFLLWTNRGSICDFVERLMKIVPRRFGSSFKYSQVVRFLSFRFMCSIPPHKSSFSPTEYRPFPIIKITDISPNTKAFELELPSPQHTTGLTTSSLIMVKGKGDEARPYTPISLGTQRGSFDLMIKAYPTGQVSSFLHSLRVGDPMYVKGPFKKLQYKANMRRRIGMIAGGTGITPMVQLLREILGNEQDLTQVNLLFANRGLEDILMKDFLDELARNYSNFNVHYVLSDPPTTGSGGWDGIRGHVDRGMIASLLPPPAPDTLIYVCGPPGMMEAVSGDKVSPTDQGSLSGHLKQLGYEEDMVYKF